MAEMNTSTYRLCKMYARYPENEWSKYPARKFGDTQGIDPETFQPIYYPLEDTLEMWINHYRSISKRSGENIEIKVVIESFEEVTKKTQTSHQEYVIEVPPTTTQLNNNPQ